MGTRPTVRFDVKRMATDMAERGWMATDLAREAGVSDMTVSRFLRRKQQTAKTAKKLAEALGHTVRRYLKSIKGIAA
jgi:transcriptional regulator with XRE-family HTH domain